jgi:hypothetical protein
MHGVTAGSVLCLVGLLGGSSLAGEPRTAGVGNGAIPEAQSKQLSRILAGFPSLRVSARLGRPPAEDRRPRAAWVYYRLYARTAIDQVRGHWQGNVASGVLRDVSRQRSWPPVLGHRFTLVLPSGRRRFESESVLGRVFQGGIDRTSEGELRRLLQESANAAGVRLVQVRFARPLGRLAPQVTVQTGDPRGFVRNAAENVWKIARPINEGSGRPRAEGTFVYVTDPDDTWVAVFAYAVRASGGSSVINPRFQ